jgi:demethylmenaquinone methyltransferase / 2-methoxy-6-polyprenyl-1,4-benzoquinol methylase
MFDAVPRRYDLLNRMLTLGLDERWRNLAVKRCLQGRPSRVLDLCCGTGDLAARLARAAPAGMEIIGLDYSPQMLAVARRKLTQATPDRAVELIEGSAAQMPFADGEFDVVNIAFAFRNLTWRNPLRDGALAEVRRVLRPGGRFVVVETSQPALAAIRTGYHMYMKGIVAPLGGWISGSRGAYRYLAASASGFYDAGQVRAMLQRVGFEHVQVQPLLAGVAAVHVATLPRH